MARILMVLSGSDHWTLKDGTRHATGYWAEEFAVPHRMFREAGLDVQVSTPGGVRPIVDPVSLSPERNGGDEQKVMELRQYLESIDGELARPLPLEEAAARAGDHDAVFIPGGHAPMEDLPTNAALGSILTDLWNSSRLIVALCHGPAGLLSANREDGSWLFAGSRLTAFTDEEERQGGLADRAPWLLEDRLRERGAIFEAGPPWQPHVVVDGDLITGQNPASSKDTASRTLGMLQALQH
ncbi:type 1 glutamine amidotransferase domain-containing protein [Pseudonocardia acidicola]|uniref:Type 1 glutamine amidotransferase domain-containing protein n=1 Tax=Pseudonocardia acidicola TaxID=2724939 RepID=A0ABX1S9N6_9PSEU|nr:type 1 glutamine amidotransferase domain-containing protein [Pseudonocardia acidicola]NMH96964.1 type 1 glutamine amidotransferase domain-containing protein [Pseudonocardia acidicola]